MHKKKNDYDQFSIGLKGLDAEHWAMAAGFDAVERAIRAIDGKRFDVETEIIHLIRMTHEHFRHEQDMMARFNYPEIELHMQEHDILHGETERLLVEVRATRELKYVMPPLKQLRQSTESHIKDADMRMARFIIASM